MGVKVKTKVNRYPKMRAALNGLDGKRVTVGVRGESAWLAGIHEYGCRIEVTPKMRAYLHSQGLHLKGSTKQIAIPERAFLRTGFDQAEGNVLRAIDNAVKKGADAETICMMVGLVLQSAIKDYARDLRDPPNHPFTASRKKSSNPLVDTGNMIESITYEVEG